MRDEQTNDQTLKIELLSQWKLEAEFRNTATMQRQIQIIDTGLDRIQQNGWREKMHIGNKLANLVC